MQNSIDHSGYINIIRENNNFKENENLVKSGKQLIRYAYDFKCGEIMIHAFERISEIEECNQIMGVSFQNENYLFVSPLKVHMPEFSTYPRNYRHPIDFVIKGYEKDSEYTEAVFYFDELQYFCPSGSIVKNDENKNVTFIGSASEIKSFDMEIDSIKCHVKFIIGAKGKYGFAHSHMEAVTELHILFPPTQDLKFLNKVYVVVDCAFAFICNRHNTTCISMRLRGSVPIKKNFTNKVIGCEMFFFDKYREKPEEKECIAETWKVSLFLKHIDKLFCMIAEDISGVSKGGGNISTSSVHPSRERRNLIDLQQSLQITGDFEFYVRRYFPSMISEKTHHTIMKMILKEIESNSLNSKLRELARNLSKNVVREPALKDKVWKVYKGDEKWESFETCFSEEWYRKDEIQILGEEVNRWRNELAHSKRSYEPKLDTIRSVRLLEHLNYAIVLRQLGFSNDEIKELLEWTLKR